MKNISLKDCNKLITNKIIKKVYIYVDKRFVPENKMKNKTDFTSNSITFILNFNLHK